MNRMVLTAAAIATLAAATPATGSAQEKGWELGAGLLSWSQLSCSGCSSTSIITTGGAYALAGFYLNPMLALEPRLAVTSTSFSGSTLTVWSIGVGVPIYFSKTWGHSGWFVEPGVAYRGVSETGSSSANQTSLNVALGGKVPLNHEASLRIAGFYNYGFKSGTIEQTNTFGIELGLSAFMK